MNDEQAVIPYDHAGREMTIIDESALEITQSRDYNSTDLAIAAYVAETRTARQIFTAYHDEECSANTRARHRDDVACFSAFLASYGIVRSGQDLYHDAEAWRGISYGLVRDFVSWMTGQGYAAGTINARLFTVRKYCKLAGPAPDGAGVLSQNTLTSILTVKGRSKKIADHIDEDRRRHHLPTRRGAKKAQSVDLTTAQALTLKKASITTTQPRTRQHDKELSAADALKLGLMIEHAFRCSEVVALDLDCFDLATGIVTFYRPKTRKTERHTLKKFTRIAAENYITQCRNEGRPTGPLFLGYKGQRLSTRAINERVALLGQSIGIEGRLSPHDLRHFWTYDALRNGTQLDQVVKGGGWTTAHMVMRYAQREGIANEGVQITEE